jgi:Mn-dependent DtxR family transcriptional regulator
MSNNKLSKSEEDYIKTIFNLSEFGNKQVSTNSISKVLK